MTSKPWFSPYSIKKQWTFGHVEIGFTSRSSNSFMGRFGGGWNWKLGIQFGGTTAVIDLLIASLRIDIRKRVAA